MLHPHATRRTILGGAASSLLLSQARIRAALAANPALANRDAANLAAGRARRRQATNYAPLTAGIVHFFGYGQSLSQGFLGAPVLSASQPFDNLMIGTATRALANDTKPPTTTWVPAGPPDSNGIYPFNPMIATLEDPTAPFTLGVQNTCGETPGEGAINSFRAAFLRRLGVTAYPATRFVFTNCGIGGKTIAQLSKNAPDDIYPRLLQAATYVQQTAQSLGLSYQVGGMIWTQGEQDVGGQTPANQYLASLQQLQADFATDVVQGIGGAPPGTTVPWFCHQPNCAGNRSLNGMGAYQALAEWATTPGSDLYLAGPVYQYPNWNPHLTANSYRWHSEQIAKAMIQVLLDGTAFLPLYACGATIDNNIITVDLSVPVLPLITAAQVFSKFTPTVYPDFGFNVHDSNGPVALLNAELVGQSTVQLTIARPLADTPYVQAGDMIAGTDIGCSLCDSDPSQAYNTYAYTPGVQQPEENIPTWNGQPLCGQPYPLNNYLAINQIFLSPG